MLPSLSWRGPTHMGSEARLPGLAAHVRRRLCSTSLRWPVTRCAVRAEAVRAAAQQRSGGGAAIDAHHDYIVALSNARMRRRAIILRVRAGHDGLIIDVERPGRAVVG